MSCSAKTIGYRDIRTVVAHDKSPAGRWLSNGWQHRRLVFAPFTRRDCAHTIHSEATTMTKEPDDLPQLAMTFAREGPWLERGGIPRATRSYDSARGVRLRRTGNVWLRL